MVLAALTGFSYEKMYVVLPGKRNAGRNIEVAERRGSHCTIQYLTTRV